MTEKLPQHFFTHIDQMRSPAFARFRREYGLEGVGILLYLRIAMWESSALSLAHDEIEDVAFLHQIDPERLQGVVDALITAKVFESDGERFHDKELTKEGHRVLKNRKIWRESGRKGAIAKKASHPSRHPSATLEATLKGTIEEEEEENKKTNKNKNQKKNTKRTPPGYREGTRNPRGYSHIWLTDAEITTLLTTYGRDALEQCFASLEEHIENGKRDYTQKKNHNLTLQNWLKRSLARGEIRPAEPEFTREALRKAVEERYGKN